MKWWRSGWMQARDKRIKEMKKVLDAFVYPIPKKGDAA
jgi:hypothetical protein